MFADSSMKHSHAYSEPHQGSRQRSRRRLVHTLLATTLAGTEQPQPLSCLPVRAMAYTCALSEPGLCAQQISTLARAPDILPCDPPHSELVR